MTSGPRRDPAGLGDGASVFARSLRLGLWREHLGRSPGEDDDLLDPATGVAAWREAAERLAAWHWAGRRSPRPPRRALPHATDSVPWWAPGGPVRPTCCWLTRTGAPCGCG